MLVACGDGPPTGPRARTDIGEPSHTSLGVVEVTIRGLGDAQPMTSARSARNVIDLTAARWPSGLNASLAPAPGGDGTIQLEPLSTDSFTEGDRSNGGVRYVWATYRVRNARKDGTPYETPRQNLTFLAVDTDSTIGLTAVSQLFRFDGPGADSAIAAQILPTGAVVRDLLTGAVVPAGPDVLQVLTEKEVEAWSRPAGQRDPDRAVARGADARRPGRLRGAGRRPQRESGHAAVGRDLRRRRPEPADLYGPRGRTRCAARGGPGHGDPLPGVHGRAGPHAELVQLHRHVRWPGDRLRRQPLHRAGAAGRRAFRGQTYTGDGTATVSTPHATFHAGEAVELVLKPRACVEGLPYVVRRRLSAAPASGTFPSFGLGFDSGLYPAQIIAADWNGDGRLDVGITSEKNYTLTSWTLNVPENQYQRHSTQLAPAPQKPPTMKTRVAAGDLNGDGVLDFVVLDCWGSRFLVGIGNGDGTFTHHVTHVLSENFGLEALAAGDIDGDGDIDLVATKTVDGRALVVLTNHGTHLSTHGEAFYGATAVGLADVNGDGNRLHGRVGRFPTGRRCEHLLGAIAAPGSDRSRAAGTPRVPSGPSDPFATSGGRGTWSATAPILPHPSAHTSVRSGLRCRRSQSGMQASRHRRNAGPVVRHARG